MADTQRREIALLVTSALLALALLYVVLLNLWGVTWWKDPLDYQHFGTWSQAISGVATSAALVVTLANLYSQRRSQRRADLAREVEAETGIFQWITSKEVRDEDGNVIGRLWDVKIQNSTIAPIYRWKIQFPLLPNHLCNSTKRPLIPGENILNLPFFDNVAASDTPEPDIVFQGRSGRFWSRSGRGVLQQVNAKQLSCEHAPSVTFDLIG